MDADPADAGIESLVERANQLDASRSHREAAALWLEIRARPDATAALQSRAVYEAQGALRLEYTEARQPEVLCEAYAVVDDHLRERGATLEASAVSEFAGYREELRSQLAVHRDIHGSVPCSEVLDDPGSERASPSPVDSPPASAGAAPDSGDRRRGRGLVIGGGVALGVSAVLLGVMGYGISETARQSGAISDLTDEVRAAGRGFQSDEWSQVQELYGDGDRARSLAIATGVSAGVLLVSGLVMVLAGARRGSPRYTLQPSRGASGASLSLQF